MDLFHLFRKDIEHITETNLPWEDQKRLFEKRDTLRKEQSITEDPLEKEQLHTDIQKIEQTLMLTNMPLVIRLAKKFYLVEGESISPDLVQEGFFGLQKAVKDYDIDRGTVFSTYATYEIRQKIQRGEKNMGTTIRLPVWARDALNKIQKMQEYVAQQLGREPTIEELHAALPSIPEEKIQRLLRHKEAMVLEHIDQEDNDEEDYLLDTYMMKNQDTSLRPTEDALVTDKIPNLLHIISFKELQLLRLLFEKNLTEKQIALLIEEEIESPAISRRYRETLKKLGQYKDDHKLSSSATFFDFQEPWDESSESVLEWGRDEYPDYPACGDITAQNP